MSNENSTSILVTLISSAGAIGMVLVGVLTGRNTRLKDRDQAERQTRIDEEGARQALITNYRNRISDLNAEVASMRKEMAEIRRERDVNREQALAAEEGWHACRHTANGLLYQLYVMLELKKPAPDRLPTLPEIPNLENMPRSSGQKPAQ